jgi:hypothetical protein
MNDRRATAIYDDIQRDATLAHVKVITFNDSPEACDQMLGKFAAAVAAVVLAATTVGGTTLLFTSAAPMVDGLSVGSGLAGGILPAPTPRM